MNHSVIAAQPKAIRTISVRRALTWRNWRPLTASASSSNSGIEQTNLYISTVISGAASPTERTQRPVITPNMIVRSVIRMPMAERLKDKRTLLQERLPA